MNTHTEQWQKSGNALTNITNMIIKLKHQELKSYGLTFTNELLDVGMIMARHMFCTAQQFSENCILPQGSLH
jgi:hypothetical protein